MAAHELTVQIGCRTWPIIFAFGPWLIVFVLVRIDIVGKKTWFWHFAVI